MPQRTHRFLFALPLVLATSLGCNISIAQPNGGLPPGLQKKVERGGELPPGWETKLRVGEILDYDIYRHARVIIPVDDQGIATVEIEGHRLKLGVDTRRIIELLD